MKHEFFWAKILLLILLFSVLVGKSADANSFDAQNTQQNSYVKCIKLNLNDETRYRKDEKEKLSSTVAVTDAHLKCIAKSVRNYSTVSFLRMYTTTWMQIAWMHFASRTYVQMQISLYVCERAESLERNSRREFGCPALFPICF